MQGIKDIELKVNFHVLKLGLIISKCNDFIQDKSTKKMGFFMARAFKLGGNQLGYYSQNCVLHCFGNEFFAAPNLDPSKGPDFIYGTNAAVIFTNNILSGIRFSAGNMNQVFSKSFFNEFCSVCDNKYSIYKQNNRSVITWQDDSAYLMAAHNMKTASAEFQLAYK